MDAEQDAKMWAETLKEHANETLQDSPWSRPAVLHRMRRMSRIKVRPDTF